MRPRASATKEAGAPAGELKATQVVSAQESASLLISKAKEAMGGLERTMREAITSNSPRAFMPASSKTWPSTAAPGKRGHMKGCSKSSKKEHTCSTTFYFLVAYGGKNAQFSEAEFVPVARAKPPSSKKTDRLVFKAAIASRVKLMLLTASAAFL